MKDINQYITEKINKSRIHQKDYDGVFEITGTRSEYYKTAGRSFCRYNFDWDGVISCLERIRKKTEESEFYVWWGYGDLDKTPNKYQCEEGLYITNSSDAELGIDEFAEDPYTFKEIINFCTKCKEQEGFETTEDFEESVEQSIRRWWKGNIEEDGIPFKEIKIFKDTDDDAGDKYIIRFDIDR